MPDYIQKDDGSLELIPVEGEPGDEPKDRSQHVPADDPASAALQADAAVREAALRVANGTADPEPVKRGKKGRK